MADPTAAPAVRRAHGVLLVHHRPTRRQFVDAANVAENIAAFSHHSRFAVWGYNTDLPMPAALPRLEFDAVLIHYSVFVPGIGGYLMPSELVTYLESSSAYKLATFQDEYHFCQERFDFIDRVGVDCVYTMLEPPHDAEVYMENTKATRVASNLPAYVGRDLLEMAERYARPLEARDLDIGYRGRPMPPYMGRGAQEKAGIGREFLERASDSGLSLDIAVGEDDRLYGPDWNRFVASSRGTLGVESGVSCFDLRGEVRAEYEAMEADLGREPTLEEMEAGALGRWDWKIPYRTLSPRNLEAAAFRVCQILYEGNYSGAIEPMRHYIPLHKDFSNLDEVIDRFTDEGLRHDIVETAYAELIESGNLTYERLVGGFDEILADAGLSPETSVGRRAVTGLRMQPNVRHAVATKWRLLAMDLQERSPRLWQAAFLLSRPVVVPARLLLRAIRG